VTVSGEHPRETLSLPANTVRAMTVPAVISLVTLGVGDVRAATAFYEALGLEKSSASVEGEVSFFRTAGGLLAVWGAEELRRDAGAGDLSPAGAFRGVALAINVESRDAVDAAIAHAKTCGATVPRPPAPTEWGGYQGYFADPDGHLWEVAHNPFWPIGADGRPQLP
jgi:predicted lactoylglutathione lyase